MPADLRQCFRVDPADLPREEVIFGRTSAMREVRGRIERILRCDLPVLLQGERGTGKDLVARFLHARSNRSDGPFVKLSCASVPRHLLEAELLGCEIGSVPGMSEAKPGLVEMAEGGTLFLDEIGEIDLALQRKLLFLLQEGRYFRVCGREERLAKVRIVCATHAHLAAAVKSGTFREDLFNHLDVMCFDLPALRERKEDIPQLWEFFAEKLALKFRETAPSLTPAVLRVLEQWDWPGNLCELESCIARIMILGDEEGIGEQLRRQAAFVSAADEREEKGSPAKTISRNAMPEAVILQVLQAYHYGQRKTTEELKRNHRLPLYRLKKIVGLQRPRRRRRFPRPE